MESKTRTESIKLFATTLNALAILLLAASLFGDWIDPGRSLTVQDRGWIFIVGVALHICAHSVLELLDKPKADER